MRIKKSHLRRIIREELEIVSRIKNRIGGGSSEPSEEVDDWILAGRGEMYLTAEMIAQLEPRVSNMEVQTWTPEGKGYTVHYIGRGNNNQMMNRWRKASAPTDGVKSATVDGKNYYFAVSETGTTS